MGDRHNCEKDSLGIVTEEVHPEASFKRVGRIRAAGHLRQTVPNRWASVRKHSFTKRFCVYMRGDTGPQADESGYHAGCVQALTESKQPTYLPY